MSNKFNKTDLIKPERFTTVSGYLLEYLWIVILATGILSLSVFFHGIDIALYKINPMHWAVYMAAIYKRPALSSLILLGFALPFTSYITTGHPDLMKSLIMGIELSIYGTLFSLAVNRNSYHPILAFLVSQVAGHLVYYMLKYLLLKTGIINGVLFATAVVSQLFAGIILGFAIWFAVAAQSRSTRI